jgi:low affinity Fe/Cu permease
MAHNLHSPSHVSIVVTAGCAPARRGGQMKAWFGQLATRAASAAGHYLAFVLAAAVVLVWGLSGPLFRFSTTWQLVINTGTTIVTFLMVFLIQNAQNRESTALQLKLDELIRAVGAASNRLIDIEDSTEEELTRLRARYQQLRTADQAGVEDVARTVSTVVKD